MPQQPVPMNAYAHALRHERVHDGQIEAIGPPQRTKRGIQGYKSHHRHEKSMFSHVFRQFPSHRHHHSAQRESSEGTPRVTSTRNACFLEFSVIPSATGAGGGAGVEPTADEAATAKPPVGEPGGPCQLTPRRTPAPQPSATARVRASRQAGADGLWGKGGRQAVPP